MDGYHSSGTNDGRESPPLQLDYGDPQLYKHLSGLVDGVTKGRITEQSTLVTLYQGTNAAVDNALLKNLTEVATPWVGCQLVMTDGELLPPSWQDSDFPGFTFAVTYDRLLLAPRVLLTCQFSKSLRPWSPYLSLMLQWHFNDYDGHSSAIQDYNLSEGKLTFTAKRVSSSGFGKIECHEAAFGDKERHVIAALRAFQQSSEEYEVILLLNETKLSNDGKSELCKIRNRLPGGVGPLLPSIGRTEYAAFEGSPHYVYARRGEMRLPKMMLRGPLKHPMVPLQCGDTFASLKEACVELAHSATVQDAESREALQLWAKSKHIAKLFHVGSFAVLAVRFKKFAKLGSVSDDVQYRLPRDLACEMEFYLPDTRRFAKVKGFSISSAPNLPRHDAFFQITSHSLEFFEGVERIEQMQHYGYFSVSFLPHYNSSTFAAQLDTVTQLQHVPRWHDILLNQTHEALASVDMTASSAVDPDVKRAADDWLLGWMDWNAEQLQAIYNIKCAKGGMELIMGPAGAGKTLLQQALAIYFHKLGFHVLALAPANSNADDLAVRLKVAKSGVPTLSYNRLFPASREIKSDKLTKEQAVHKEVGHTEGNVLPFPELLIALDHQDAVEGTAREFGVVEAIIDAANEGRLVLSQRLRDKDGVMVGDFVNPWDLLREFIAKYAKGGKDREALLKAKEKLDRYKRAYRACKGHIIGLNRFMITTTGNVRSEEMLRDWFDPEKEYGVECVGVVVFVDEAAKDLEANVWSGIVCQKWADHVTGVFLFGDDKQLAPTNTSAKGKVQFNAFSGRLDIPLPSRLAREGFPCIRLLEQRRMHQAIAGFPNREVYDGMLRNEPGTAGMLDHGELPGFGQVLLDIQAQAQPQGFFSIKSSEDDQARLAWIEVDGRRIRHESTMSLCVMEHIDVFFRRIFPRLHAYFKLVNKDMGKYVMLICAYGYALQKYEEMFDAFLARNSTLTAADVPTLLTVDASQGRESFMVILDASCQHADIVGFMADKGRTNVAITRAKEVFWTIGGRMKERYGDQPTNLLTKYKRELDAAGKTHRFR